MFAYATPSINYFPQSLGFIPSVGNIRLTDNYVYGQSPQQRIGGDIVVNMAGALKNKMASINYLDVVKPTITTINGSPAIEEVGDFLEGVFCQILVSYNGTTLRISYNAEI